MFENLQVSIILLLYMYHLVSDFDVLEISANPMETAFAKSDKIHSKLRCKVKGGTGVIVLRFFCDITNFLQSWYAPLISRKGTAVFKESYLQRAEGCLISAIR